MERALREGGRNPASRPVDRAHRTVGTRLRAGARHPARRRGAGGELS